MRATHRLRPAAPIGWILGRILELAFGIIFGLVAALARAGEPCRIAFDMGSSGIRAGASQRSATPRVDIDYLGPLQAGRGFEEVVAPTIMALRDLPQQGGFAAECERFGGGFSAWRLALAQDAGALIPHLARIQAASGVAVLVIPQRVEGAYAYASAKKLLGAQLTTSHVLDIGGGSMQIAGERTAFVATLGQKVWHRHLCREIRGSDASCVLPPLTGDELFLARNLLSNKLKGVAAALPETVTLTAISRPVSRGILPAIERVAGGGDEPKSGIADIAGISRVVITESINRIAGLTIEKTVELLGKPGDHVRYLLSDLLLVEGVMAATGGNYMKIADIDVTNLPGLLGDDRGFEWGRRYDCYLARLRQLGVDAYASDPASCP